jgi:hypothetical protein
VRTTTGDRTLQLARAYTTYGDVLYGEGRYAEAADWYRRADAVRQGAPAPGGRAAGPTVRPARARPS